ncbi:MAG: hypothetical protein VX278_10430 [Myxococcota bacterium]|nr:hypothetical protein [Myxococcota bacterium]
MTDPAEETGEANELDTGDTEESLDTGTTEEPSHREEWDFDSDLVTVEFDEADGLRTYSLRSTHPQRDNGPMQRQFAEREGDPILRSGHALTDALFAMAVHEARENSVSQIADGLFSSPQNCECYETGELWNWVWTRDIAYATELGLGWLDPERAQNSLLFKLSEEKTGGRIQIVQDTGTGGSWPVSTDRVTWARGAMSVLRHTNNSAFEAQVIEAFRNTAETDRQYAYDPRDGLYYGESSFLDWREQSYPAWVQDNPVHIAMSKSLSTNLNHLFLLRALESLTGEDHHSQDLATAIDTHFWKGTYYSSYKLSELNPVTTHQQDLLATALAVLDLGTHPEALAQYPHSSMGAPVIFPQQQYIPIYHNRAIWPFVSSYAVLAARKADNGAVFDANLESLIRGAALNLSHMENFEWQSGKNWVEDGDYSGPIVNSRRQLWSVAGFLGVIVQGVFGLEKENGSWNASPILPGRWFSEDATLIIDGESFSIGSATLSSGSITYADEDDWQNLFSAAAPIVEITGSGNDVTLSISTDGTTSFDIYRDGVLIEENGPSSWTDNTSTSSCYAAVAQRIHPSHPSSPTCWWGDDYQRIQTIAIDQFNVTGGMYSTNHGRPHQENWGEPHHQMSVTITPNATGEHYIQLVYGNGSNSIDSGITAAVKWVRVVNSDGTDVASGSIVMPQLGRWDRWGDSSFLPVALNAGESYTVTISDGWNMSYLSHYTELQFNGGGEVPYNYVNITEMKLLFMR